MRVVSHTCSNTEIVCALGCGDVLVGIDDDSDFPSEIVASLPKLGRDLELDVERVAALRPDLVLTSLTVPGHERIVAGLQACGLHTVVIDPHSLEEVYASIQQIAALLAVPARGAALVAQMRAAMPPVKCQRRPKILVEWWPKPVIAPARESWVTQLIELAGGENVTGAHAGKSVEANPVLSPEAIVMSWCGVKVDKYRAEVVARREGWSAVPAIRDGRIHAISEEFLGRPGPRLVEGYRALRAVIGMVRQ